MNQGRIEQVGTPRQLYERPNNRFVAGFLGEANLFRVASVEGTDGALTATTGEGLRLAAESRPAKDGPLCACVRPEAVRLVRDEAAGENRVTGRMEDVTYTAGSVRYRVRTQEGALITVREPSERGYALPAPGDEATLVWRAADTLLIADEG